MIRYVVPADRGPQRVSIRIFEATGRLVRTLIDSPQPAGSYIVSWAGESASEARAASGVYFCQVKIGGWQETRSALLVR